MPDAQAAIQRLYEETSVRDELIDEEAELLLRWAEEQVIRLATERPDPAVFEEAYSDLVRLLTRMSRFAAGRSGMSLDDVQTAMSRIEASASAVGLQPGGFVAQTAPDDILGTLQALMAYVAPAADEPPMSEPPGDEPPSTSEPPVSETPADAESPPASASPAYTPPPDPLFFFPITPQDPFDDQENDEQQ